MDLPVSNGCSWWSDRGEIEIFTSIQLQIISDPSLYSFCILWFIDSMCYRWRNEYRKRKNFYWRESAIGFVLFTGINAPLIVFQEEKQVQLVIFTDGSLLIKIELSNYWPVVPGSPLERGKGVCHISAYTTILIRVTRLLQVPLSSASADGLQVVSTFWLQPHFS